MVKAFLDRVQTLREGTDPEREDTREEDRAAVSTLEGRNIVGEEIESRLRGLIKEATRLVPEPSDDKSALEEHYETARRFSRWLTATARTSTSVCFRNSRSTASRIRSV